MKFFLIILSNILLFSYTINITKGWQLKGAIEDIDVNSTFNNKNILSVWSYKNNKWKFFSPNKDVLEKIKNVKILEKIKQKEGFWINSKKDFSIETIFVDYNLKGTIPDKTITIKTVTNENLRAYLWFPKNYSPNKKYPAIIMVHGCGGVHYKDDPKYWNKNYVAGKYKMWGELLSKNGFIVLLVDSFTTRDNNDVGKGVCDTKDPLNRPPKIDPISVRPGDIASAVAYLKSRDDINKTKIGILAFSNGATSALVFANHTSLVNRKDLQEKNIFNIPLDEKYKANVIVALYPGCGLNGYTPQTQHIFDNKFEIDTPTYIFMASDDKILPEDTKNKCFHLKELDNNLSIIEVPNTDHQFDYYEREKNSVKKAILEIIKIFKSM